MKAKSPVTAKARQVNNPAWDETRMIGNTLHYPNRERWIRSGGKGSNGSGPSGWKLRRAKVLARSLAERTSGK